MLERRLGLPRAASHFWGQSGRFVITCAGMRTRIAMEASSALLGHLPLARLCRSRHKDEHYVARALQLAFLAPKIVEAVIVGTRKTLPSQTSAAGTSAIPT